MSFRGLLISSLTVALVLVVAPASRVSAAPADEAACAQASSQADNTVKLAYATELAAIDKLMADAEGAKIDPTKASAGGQTTDLVKLRSRVAQQQASALQDIDQASKSCIAGKDPPSRIALLADDYVKRQLVALIPKPLQSGTRTLARDASIDKSFEIFRQQNGETFDAKTTTVIASVTQPDIFNGGFGGDTTFSRVPHRHAFTPGTDIVVTAQPQTGTANTSPLDVALAKMTDGTIAFNNPGAMTIGRPAVVQAVLSTTLAPEALEALLTEAGQRESANLKVADRMAATLSGGTAFDISPSGPQTQLISKAQTTTWTWEVTPKTDGDQFLILTLDAVLTVDGREGTRNARTLTKQIHVRVDWPPHTIDGWFDLLKTWTERIGWFWTTLLLPLVYFLFPRFKPKPPTP